MKKRILACAALLFAAFSPAMAEDGCQPLDKVLAGLAASGAPKSAIVSMPDPEMTRKYLELLPLKPPAGSQPSGMLFATAKGGVVAGLIEPQGCIRHYAIVPHDKHNKALSQVFRDV
jgi:hypothetical protein|uniref:Uncharacterized protein n=1 Tax=viral metagenome TaxID=1070528 RepID=A0A6H1ZB74_9ZZZZ